MLVIRLFRVGKKNQPSFKIVVIDKRKAAKAGRFVEQVGFWNPLTKERILQRERIKYWLSVGVKPSATVHNMLISEKIIEGKKIPKHKIKKVEETKTSVSAEKVAEEKPGPETKAEAKPEAEEKKETTKSF